MLTSLRISKGNTKLGKIPNISLPPIVSCQKGVPCATSGCYSLKAMRMYPSVREARFGNWELLKRDREKYFNELSSYISTEDPAYFRVHVDGDIPDQDYLDRLSIVAYENPRTNFLSFTKNYSLKGFRRTKNLTIIPSLWTHYGDSDQWDIPKAWILDHKDTDTRLLTNYYICKGHCTGCWACWHIDKINKDVVFPVH